VTVLRYPPPSDSDFSPAKRADGGEAYERAKRAAVKYATVDMVVVAAVQGDEVAEAEASDEGDAVQMSDAVGEGKADNDADANDETEAGDDFLSGTSFGLLVTTRLRSVIWDAAQHISLDDVKRLAAFFCQRGRRKRRPVYRVGANRRKENNQSGQPRPPRPQPASRSRANVQRQRGGGL
jgi:hypothetical protein